MYSKAGKPEAALHDLNEALKLDGSMMSALLQRGHTHFALGQCQEAAQDYMSVLR